MGRICAICHRSPIARLACTCAMWPRRWRCCTRGATEVFYDAEHFFDGFKGNPAYALACAKAAYDSGARWVVLCDTNGGTLPHEVEAIVTEVCKLIPGDHIGIHAHNDTEQAVANSLAAVRAHRLYFLEARRRHGLPAIDPDDLSKEFRLMTIQRGTMAYRYRGLPLLKNPFDLALYPLLIEQADAELSLGSS